MRGYILQDNSSDNTIFFGWQTFTPTVTLVGGTGNTVPVYATNNGRYLQAGDIVFVDVYLNGDGGAEGAGTGQINIALPVTAGASINGSSIGIIGLYVNNNNDWTVSGLITAGSSTVELTYADTISTYSILTGADQNNTNRSIRIHFWYEI